MNTIAYYQVDASALRALKNETKNLVTHFQNVQGGAFVAGMLSKVYKMITTDSIHGKPAMLQCDAYLLMETYRLVSEEAERCLLDEVGWARAHDEAQNIVTLLGVLNDVCGGELL